MLKWKVDPDTLEFLNLGLVERGLLRELCAQIIKGKFDVDHPAITAWLKAVHLETLSNEPKKRMADKFCQMALWSLIRAHSDNLMGTDKGYPERARCQVKQHAVLIFRDVYWLRDNLFGEDSDETSVYSENGTFVGYFERALFEVIPDPITKSPGSFLGIR